MGREPLVPFLTCLGGEEFPSNLRAEDGCGQGTQPGDSPLAWGLGRVEAETRKKPILRKDWQKSFPTGKDFTRKRARRQDEAGTKP